MKRPQAVILIQERDAVGTIPSTDELSRVDYCGNMVYDRGERRLLIGNGYVTFDLQTNAPSYHFYLRDHLGNNRVVMAGDGTVEQVTHYYPFGGVMRESTNPGLQPYKYGGKELDRTSGLDAYDFGARMYFADRLQWGQMDPLCEKYYDVSPYNYCVNKPVNAFDSDGKENISFLPNKDKETSDYSNYANDIPNVINIWAHGVYSSEDTSEAYGFSVYREGKETIIKDSKAFEHLLSTRSNEWNKNHKESVTIVFHVCGAAALAKQFSESPLFKGKNITFIAANNKIAVTGNKKAFVKNRTNKNGSLVYGAWFAYKDGKEVAVYNRLSTPGQKDFDYEKNNVKNINYK